MENGLCEQIGLLSPSKKRTLYDTPVKRKMAHIDNDKTNCTTENQIDNDNDVGWKSSW